MEINYRKTKFLKVAATISQCPDQDLPEIVLCGKSNVGKSSLVNAIADNKKLARVSQTPGKTREVVYFEADGKLLIADLPGYGYAKASKEVKERFSKLCDDYFRSGRHIDLVLCLIDIRHEPSTNDINMIEFLNNNGLPYFVVFTKCDKLSKMLFLPSHQTKNQVSKIFVMLLPSSFSKTKNRLINILHFVHFYIELLFLLFNTYISKKAGVNHDVFYL